MGKISVILLLFLTSCASYNSFGAAPIMARNFPPPGPPNYQQGMEDGCRSALGAIGGSGAVFAHSEMLYYDVDKALGDPVYYRAWKDAYFYCKYDHDKGAE